MEDLRFTEFEGETIVVHYGGDPSINVYTLTQSLAGFADTARAISAIIDPGHEIEILIEATGPGSFRALIRRITKPAVLGSLFAGVAGSIFWNVVSNVIYDKYIKEDMPIVVVVKTDEVVVKSGDKTIVVPRKVYEAAENAKKDPEVERCIRKTIEPLQNDPKVTGFGLTTNLEAAQVPLYIPREEFPRLTRITVIPSVTTETQRTNTATARLVILKAWLNQAKRKWSFEWNGVPISAPIKDAQFLEDIAHRKYLIGAGDALDVEVTFVQNYDPNLKVFVNDQNSFVITRVIAHVPKQPPII
jgi:hypothetical protein